MSRTVSRSHSKVVGMCLAILLISSSAARAWQYGKISIDYVTNSIVGTQLRAGFVHQLGIRFDFRNGPSNDFSGTSTNNTFEVYSPDGADWGSLTGREGLLSLSLPPSTLSYLRHYNYSGSAYVRTANNGADPAAGYTGPGSRSACSFGTMGMDQGRFQWGVSNGIAVILEFSSRAEDEGRHICVDTVMNQGTVYWEWSFAGDGTWPPWDNGLGESGPRCWEIAICSGPDSDGDGVPDACDACPGYDDRLDNDQDMIPDGCEAHAAGPAIEVDSVEGLLAPGVLASGRLIKFRFRVTTDEQSYSSLALCISLFSYDGAVWNPPLMEIVPGFPTLAGTVTNGNIDGQELDYMTLNGGSIIQPGYMMLPAGFSEVLFTIETRLDPSQAGKTVWINNCRAPDGWSMTTTGNVTVLPDWYGLAVYQISPECCMGRVGDANGYGGDEPTIGDVVDMISMLFLSGTPVNCIKEADINQSGGINPTRADITIGDISSLIDYLFITGPTEGILPDCL